MGIGGRARFFYEGLAKSFSEQAELTGFCDINRKRVDFAYEDTLPTAGRLHS